MQKVYTKIESIVGNVVTVRAEGVRSGDLALVGESYASVIKLSGDLVSLQVFAGTQGVSTTDTVRFLGRPMMVSFSDDLLGRVFDGAGVPRDNGPALTENMIPIGGPSVNPAKRIVPKRMIRTGIPMIDVNTLVESQKLPIFSVSGEPYNQLLARIAMQAEVDVIVLGGMGLKYDDYLFFRDTLEKSGAMGRTVMFVHTASDPTVECTLVPDLSLAVAEQFALAGKRVLVLLTDMTNFADAQKEMAITMEQVPSNRGYPGDLYTAALPRAMKRRSTLRVRAPSPSSASPRCPATTSPTPCRTTQAISPRASITSKTATSSRSARSRVSSRTSTARRAATTAP